MRISLIFWSFVTAFCSYNFLTATDVWNAVICGGGALISLYMWIYALIMIIRTDLPIQVKFNIDTKIKQDKENKNAL